MRSASGSTQTEVPVNPVCPKARGDIFSMADAAPRQGPAAQRFPCSPPQGLSSGGDGRVPPAGAPLVKRLWPYGPRRRSPWGPDTTRRAGRMTERIGKYEVVRKIGSGGFGAVYEARDPVIKRTVAIKTCHVEDERIRARFAQEAELAGNLHHRNLMTIHDFGVEGSVLYLVCEFLAGEDLKAIIERGKPLSLVEKVEILIGIAYGLAHAHDAGVVHRDIKPSNIRVLPDGTVKIMDFGVAKSMYAERSLTRTGFTVGTAAYLAPEQVRGEPVDRRTDIFSFSVLAYELLTSRKPFTGTTHAEMLDAIAKAEPEPLAAMAPETPPALIRLVEQAMRKNPSERYPSMEPIRRELLAIHEELVGAAALASTAAESHPLADVPLSRPAAIEQPRASVRAWAIALLVALAVACALLFWLVPRLTP